MTNYNDGNWHDWSGGECPVHLNAMVIVVLRGDHYPLKGFAGLWMWKHFSNDGDIIKFRVTDPALTHQSAAIVDHFVTDQDLCTYTAADIAAAELRGVKAGLDAAIPIARISSLSAKECVAAIRAIDPTAVKVEK